MALLGGNVNRRKAVFVALVDVAARQTDIIYWSNGVSRETCHSYALYLVLGFVFVIRCEVQRGGNESLGLNEGKGPNAHSAP